MSQTLPIAMTNPKFSFVLLYVDNPPASAIFYAGLLGIDPIETSPTFAMLPAAPGVMLGLWSKHAVIPAATMPGGSEFALTVPDAAAVDATHDAWVAHGLPIAQAPSTLDFGRTFVALDLDGHRIRVFAPGGEP
jgi:catechol 2,3-dioxygenase-like lactoylglutathione lyase family enzyme